MPTMLGRLSTCSEHISRAGRDGSVSVFQRRNGINKGDRSIKKCCRCRVLKKRGGYQCRCGENVRNECCSVTKTAATSCIDRYDESAAEPRPSPACGGLKEAAKSQKRTHHQAPKQRSFLGNGGRKFREGRKRLR